MPFKNIETFYFIITLFSLLVLAWQDYKNHMVDSRKISYISGVTSCVIFLNFSTFTYFFMMILLSLGFNYLFSKAFLLAEGDRLVLTPLFLGLGFIQIDKLFIFVTVLFVLTLLQRGYYFYVKKQKEIKLPYFPIILLTWILTQVLNNL